VSSYIITNNTKEVFITRNSDGGLQCFSLIGIFNKKTHQEMRQRTWTFFSTTSHMYYCAPSANCTTRRIVTDCANNRKLSVKH